MYCLISFSSSTFGQVSDFKQDVAVVKKTLLEVLDFRMKAENFGKSLEEKIKSNIPVNGRELQEIHETVMTRVAVTDFLMTYVEKYRPYIDQKTSPNINNEERIKGVPPPIYSEHTEMLRSLRS